MILDLSCISFLVSDVCVAEAHKAIVRNMSKVTESQLQNFINLCWVKYVKARIEPGMIVSVINWFVSE